MKVVKSIAFLLLIGSLCSIDTEAARSRSKQGSRKGAEAAAALVGAGAGGGLAVKLGSAKWAPLGIFGGAAAGFLLIRALRNNREEAQVNHAKKISERRETRNGSHRRHVRAQTK